MPSAESVAPVAASQGVHCFDTHIRGRHGFDVVGSPAELQAEVSGRPLKTTGKTTQVRNLTSHSLPSLNT